MSVPEIMETVMMCAQICKGAISAPVSREILPSIQRISKHALVSGITLTQCLLNLTII